MTLAQFLCLPEPGVPGLLADFVAGEMRNASSATEHDDATGAGEAPYNGRYFVTTCACGARFLGRDPDEADSELDFHTIPD
jgi:hypothetical protein